MKVLIDATNLLDGGGRTHLIEFTNRLAMDPDCIDSVLILGRRDTLDCLADAKHIEKLEYPVFRKNFYLRGIWQQLILPFILSREKVDLLFSPGGITPIFARVKKVTMCRNMLPWTLWEIAPTFSKVMLRNVLLRIFQTLSFRSCDGVIFLSDYAQTAVCSRINLGKPKIKIIPHGVNRSFRTIAKQREGHREKEQENVIRLVYVSRIDNYKNQIPLLVAFDKLINENFNLELHLIGKSDKDYMKKISSIIQSNQLLGSKLFLYENVPYYDMPSFVVDFDIGIFASSCENLPNTLIEKLVIGLPTLTSNIRPMSDILPDPRFLFDPKDPDSIYKTLKSFLLESSLRVEASILGKEVTRDFSWDASYHETLSFLRSIMKD